MQLKLIIFMIILQSSHVLSDNPLLIKTTAGDVMGKYIKSYEGRTAMAFEGIPYAKPPLGNLRFKDPVPPDVWDGVLAANKSYTCKQFITINGQALGTEDCLYINVYVPRATITGNEDMSVVVHIHGGAFMIGSPKYCAGSDYILDEDVIYVNFNYRLGPFGFLSTEDDISPGNYGLKDQVLALKWINKNIKYFGGDPNSVTLTGASAGGASVQFHYLSPLSKGLFHRGLSQSGTVLNSWAYIEEPLRKTRTLANLLNCPIASNGKMVDCLREQNSDDMVKSIGKMLTFSGLAPFCLFGPTVDQRGKDPFLPEHPYKLLSEGKLVNDVPWVASFTKDEGIYPTGFFVLSNRIGELTKDFDSLASVILDYNETVCENQKPEVAKKIREFYFIEEPANDNICNLIRLLSERLFKFDGEKAIRLHREASKSAIYFYYYKYQLKMGSPFPKSVKGVAHMDDGKLIFHITGTPSKLPNKDKQMKDVLIDFLYKYATTNIPTMNNVEWTPISVNSEIDTLVIKSPTDIQMENISELSSTEFWKSLPIYESKLNDEGTIGLPTNC